MTRKHIHVPLHQDAVPTESHNDGQRDGYFLRTLRVVIYEKSMTNRIHCIPQVVEASALRWMFEGEM
jgi:hypothetical protein